MNLSTLRAHQRWLAPAVLLLAIAAAVGTQTAFAKIVYNTIDPVATIAAHGSQVTVTGPITVTAGEFTFLRVTVTQRSTGAIAEGIAFLIGTGALQQWRVTAAARRGGDRTSFPAPIGFPSLPPLQERPSR